MQGVNVKLVRDGIPIAKLSGYLVPSAKKADQRGDNNSVLNGEKESSSFIGYAQSKLGSLVFLQNILNIQMVKVNYFKGSLREIASSVDNGNGVLSRRESYSFIKEAKKNGNAWSFLSSLESTRINLDQKPSTNSLTKVSPTYRDSFNKLMNLLKVDNRSNYDQMTSPFYVKDRTGLVVRYLDSKQVHTEGYAYVGFLLTNSTDKGTQPLFNSLVKASESYFYRIQDRSVLSWRQNADDSATDADVMRITNFYQSVLNQRNGSWSDDHNFAYDKAVEASQDFLDIGVKRYPNGLAVPMAAINNSENIESRFIIREKDDDLFLFNPSYSFSYASNLLQSLDDRWSIVKKSQNVLNHRVIDKFGIVDWITVRVNRESGAFQITNELDKFEEKRRVEVDLFPSIEWPRLIVDHLLSFIRFKDIESLKMLLKIRDKYGTNLKGLSFSGYRNELIIAMTTLLKVVFGELTESDVADFEQKVLGGASYYGSRHYNSTKHSFQQLLVKMLIEQGFNKVSLDPRITQNLIEKIDYAKQSYGPVTVASSD